MTMCDELILIVRARCRKKIWSDLAGQTSGKALMIVVGPNAVLELSRAASAHHTCEPLTAERGLFSAETPTFLEFGDLK